MRRQSRKGSGGGFHESNGLGKNICGNGQEDYLEIRAAATRRADRQAATGREPGRKEILIGWPFLKFECPMAEWNQDYGSGQKPFCAD
jgi:hypothetical protein